MPKFTALDFKELSADDQFKNADEFYEMLNHRRTVRVELIDDRGVACKF